MGVARVARARGARSGHPPLEAHVIGGQTAYSFQGTEGVAWTGLTEDDSASYGGAPSYRSAASLEASSTGTPRTVSYTFASTLNGGTSSYAGVVAAYSAVAGGAPESSSRRMTQGHGGMTGGMQMKRRASGLYVPRRELILPRMEMH